MRKLKNLLIAIAGLSLSLGAAIGVGLNNREAKEAKASNNYGTTWYFTGKTDNEVWDTFYAFTYNSSLSRYEKVITVSDRNDGKGQFKIYNEAKYNASYGLHRGMNGDLINYSRGWSTFTDWATGDNFLLKRAATYVISYDSTIESAYNNPGLAFEIELRYGLIGLGGDWDNDQLFARQNNGTFQLSLHLNEGDSFKFRSAGSWGYEWGYQSVNNSGHFRPSDENDDNSNIIVKEGSGGTYTFTIPSGLATSNQASVITYSMVPDISDGIYLRGSWGENDYGWSQAGQKTSSVVEAGSVYSFNNIVLGAGGTVKVVKYASGVMTWGQPNNVTSTNSSEYPVTKPSDGKGGYNVRVTNAGTYSLTVTKVNDTTWNYTFTGTSNPNLEAAISFAEDFVEAMYAECPYNNKEEEYNDGKTSDTIAAEWENQMSIYAALVESKPGVATYIETDAGGTVDEITLMWASYDYVYGHYATVRAVNYNNADFLNRDPDIVASLSVVVSTPYEQSSSETALVIVISISAVSLVAVGGYFFYRKRKEY